MSWCLVFLAQVSTRPLTLDIFKNQRTVLCKKKSVWFILETGTDPSVCNHLYRWVPWGAVDPRGPVTAVLSSSNSVTRQSDISFFFHKNIRRLFGYTCNDRSQSASHFLSIKNHCSLSTSSEYVQIKVYLKTPEVSGVKASEVVQKEPWSVCLVEKCQTDVQFYHSFLKDYSLISSQGRFPGVTCTAFRASKEPYTHITVNLRTPSQLLMQQYVPIRDRAAVHTNKNTSQYLSAGGQKSV